MLLVPRFHDLKANLKSRETYFMLGHKLVDGELLIFVSFLGVMFGSRSTSLAFGLRVIMTYKDLMLDSDIAGRRPVIIFLEYFKF